MALISNPAIHNRGHALAFRRLTPSQRRQPIDTRHVLGLLAWLAFESSWDTNLVSSLHCVELLSLVD